MPSLEGDAPPRRSRPRLLLLFVAAPSWLLLSPALPPPLRLCREELADWQQLQAGGAGIDWLMVAPLAAGNAGGDPRQQQKQQKQPGQKHRVLGAVVVAGRGQAPTIDGEWLREFSCEMGCLISHASVQLMEVRPRCRARVMFDGSGPWWRNACQQAAEPGSHS